MHILGAIAEFERARIAERIKAGLERARAEGWRLGRPRRVVAESVLAPVRAERAGCRGKARGVCVDGASVVQGGGGAGLRASAGPELPEVTTAR
jgi:hypothetical protein